MSDFGFQQQSSGAPGETGDSCTEGSFAELAQQQADTPAPAPDQEDTSPFIPLPPSFLPAGNGDVPVATQQTMSRHPLPKHPPVQAAVPADQVADQAEVSLRPLVAVTPEPTSAPADAEKEHVEHAGAGDTLNEVDIDLEQLKSSLAALSERFDKRLSYDDTKEKVIDRQHNELTKLREGLTKNLLRPVLYDIAEALDDIRKTKNALEKREDSKPTVSALEGVEDSLLYILEKNDVERVESEEGSPFTAARQRMIKTQGTTDPEHSRQIAHSLAPGYLYGKEPLFKEKVVVYKVVERTEPVTPTELGVTPPGQASK